MHFVTPIFFSGPATLPGSLPADGHLYASTRAEHEDKLATVFCGQLTDWETINPGVTAAAIELAWNCSFFEPIRTAILGW